MTASSVKCSAGLISGKSINNIHYFYGIPYAEPLTKKTQWNAPIPLKKEISFQASTKGFSSPQTVYSKSFFHDTSLPKESIDCLSLNIASKNLNANMPVMIWIHGGAYITGSANSAVYSLESIPTHDVVLVTINYRLGPFGFLKLDEVTSGDISSSGNEGLMDQKLAIEWVKKNIREFGGNPDNITLFGESAGAWSVALQSSVSPDGSLFSKAICQSGGMNAYFKKDRANEWGELFIKTARDAGIKLGELSNASHQQIIELAKKMRHTMIADGKWLAPEVGFAPVADGKFLPEDPLVSFKDSNINLIVGTTADEYRLWSEFEPYYLNLTEDQFLRRLRKMFQEKFIPNIQELYLDKSLGRQKYKHALSNIMTDWTFGIHAMDMLESHQNQSYAYQFNVPSPLLDGRLGAYHSSELPYLFGSCTKEFSDWCSKDAEEISDFLQVSWTQFAKTGSPTSHLLDWPSYETTNLIAQINSNFELKPYNNVKKIRLINEAKIIY